MGGRGSLKTLSVPSEPILWYGSRHAAQDGANDAAVWPSPYPVPHRDTTRTLVHKWGRAKALFQSANAGGGAGDTFSES